MLPQVQGVALSSAPCCWHSVRSPCPGLACNHHLQAAAQL